MASTTAHPSTSDRPACWTDGLRPSLISTGTLHRQVLKLNVSGIVSSALQLASVVARSEDYDPVLRENPSPKQSAEQICNRLLVRDIQLVAELLLPKTGGLVSSFGLPFTEDVEHLVDEARRLASTIDRVNVLLQLPANDVGCEALSQLVEEGVPVHAGPIFSVQQLERLWDAYLRGARERIAASESQGIGPCVVSVGIERMTNRALHTVSSKQSRDRIQRLCTRWITAAHRKRLESGFSTRLPEFGAGAMRLLWLDRSWPDPLPEIDSVAEHSVRLVPQSRLHAAEHSAGASQAESERTLDDASEQTLVRELDALLTGSGDALVQEDSERKVRDFEHALRSIERKRTLLDRSRPRVSLASSTISVEVDTRAEHARQVANRLWQQDSSLWTGGTESQWMEWMNPAEANDVDVHRSVVDVVENNEFEQVVVLGMGGSSLCAEVLSSICDNRKGFPHLRILDSTHPESVASVDNTIDPQHTLFVVSSKSGGTSETLAFKNHFMRRTSAILGEAAGSHFVAITDPGSSLVELAQTEGFRACILGAPGIGGRFSALSPFGMVPAGAMGIDVEDFLRRTQAMVEACSPVASDGTGTNPGVDLGLWLGTLANQSKDKLTLLIDEAIAPFGAWLEQLVAESTGKQGKGIIPIVDEPRARTDSYGDDRMFVRILLDSHPDDEVGARAAEIERRGLPIRQLSLASIADLGQEFFRWEIATAVAASVMRIDPFNQPDVESAKIETKTLSEAFARGASTTKQAPSASSAGLALYGEPRDGNGPKPTLESALGAHIAQITHGDYFAIQAFVHKNPAAHQHLEAIRRMILEHKGVATTLGYGPRFLHSTGQLHKGGANNGVFLQITTDSAHDIEIPGRGMSFADLMGFQAEGDLRVLRARGRRIVRVHLDDASTGLAELRETIASIL